MAASIPAMLTLYVTWFTANLLRPLLIMLAALVLLNFFQIVFKIRLAIQGILYLLFCNDKSWKKPQDPAAVFKPLMSDPTAHFEKKTIVFVRHGESTWNDTFNKGHHRSALVFALGFIPGLIKAVLYELYLALSGKPDSWFYDAPLSREIGLGQVEELAKFLSQKPSGMTEEEAKMWSILRADPGAPASQLLCSSLRRALSTIAAGFRDRFARRPYEKMLVVPSLQEISRNPDTLSITPAHKQVVASWIERRSKVCNFQGIFFNQTDMRLHTGNKPINTNGLKRMNEFCEFVFSSVEPRYVIVGGHSIWFRSFFRTFLPYQSTHVSKKNKIQNGGVVSFTLLKAPTPTGNKFMIDPKSIQVVYGGF